MHLADQGRRWYILALGPYPDRRRAQAALDALPDAFHADKPWVRSVGQLRALGAR